MTSPTASTLGFTFYATAVAATASLVPTQAVAYSRKPIPPTPEVAIGSAVRPTLSINDEVVSYEFWPDATRHLVELCALDVDHNGEGAKKPDRLSIQTAISFIRQLPFYSPEPLTGVGSDGFAVIEFHELNDFAQIVFFSDRTAEVVYLAEGRDPVGFEGVVTDDAFRASFSQTFGFRLVA